MWSRYAPKAYFLLGRSKPATIKIECFESQALFYTASRKEYKQAISYTVSPLAASALQRFRQHILGPRLRWKRHPATDITAAGKAEPELDDSQWIPKRNNETEDVSENGKNVEERVMMTLEKAEMKRII